MGASLPADAGPVLVVLLLGVTTDYSVFFLAGMRARLADGARRVPAARLATAEFAPIILAAGLIVAATTATLLVARDQSLREFGPALALTVLTAMAVSMTLTPALMAVLGGLLFHSVPYRRLAPARRSRPAPEPGAQAAVVPPAGDPPPRDPPAGDPPPAVPAPAAPPPVVPSAMESPSPGSPSPEHPAAGPVHSRREGTRVARRPPPGILRGVVARLAATWPAALLAAAVCTAGLLAAAWFARHPQLGSPLVNELPASAATSAQSAAAKGFAPGILSPADIMVTGPGLAAQMPALTRLQHELVAQPGVAEVAGPATVSELSGVPRAAPNPLLARSGNAARFVVVQDSDPLGATAISQLEGLQARLPALARSAGLTRVCVTVGGETALAGDAISGVLSDLRRVVVAIVVVSLVLLAIFLRSLLAPAYLLSASVLAVLASLGLTVLVSRYFMGTSILVYFVPIAGGVLLVSLGSDYNVFVVGRIWEEARRRPLREAVRVAVPRASRAITTAGVALAASFAMLAVIPLEQFRQIALLMGAGVILDALVVRSVLVPALVVLFGRVGTWPAPRRKTQP